MSKTDCYSSLDSVLNAVVHGVSGELGTGGDQVGVGGGGGTIPNATLSPPE